ncbi:hypothetical protein HID58_024723 [Brassica napus]|uniref:Uncharacterized protein n=1 Tax=Brassica napus TaxID=3708 RepID=A0ABQ8CKH1_BRANA|nr:hypothetical protein HID58_024723 [Brassica napus]
MGPTRRIRTVSLNLRSGLLLRPINHKHIQNPNQSIRSPSCSSCVKELTRVNGVLESRIAVEKNQKASGDAEKSTIFIIAAKIHRRYNRGILKMNHRITMDSGQKLDVIHSRINGNEAKRYEHQGIQGEQPEDETWAIIIPEINVLPWWSVNV